MNRRTQSQAQGRRRFLKNSAVASTVIVGASSRPLWAGVSCSVSGTMSGNLSNQVEDPCTAAPATALSPGYWHKWIEVFEAVSTYNSYNEACAGCKNIKDAAAFEVGTMSKNKLDSVFDTLGGEGTPINVLYNFLKAAKNVPKETLNLFPAEAMMITEAGNAVLDTSDIQLRNFFAAALSIALGGAFPEFPFPDNPWTLEYLIQNRIDHPDVLNSLLEIFFEGTDGDHLIPSNLGTVAEIGITDPEAAFDWAKAELSAS
ncbi:hypothetical protein [Motiliproteus sp. SC1-56]|uniref:hypothetical protein n=1 Tax=Motiliproteus sp. SC1-56 TaxID=2799565 RepID=UPI001A8E99B2|nr:hypothetical protein [Motiliproteus sp. SC1-56]